MLDKLSPEIRLRIYGHIFGASCVIKPGHSHTALGMRKNRFAHITNSFAPPAAEVLLDISVLLVNKSIFAEALPALYDGRTIRAATYEFDQLLLYADFVEQVRHIEIADCIGHYQSDSFHSVLRRLQVLPTVRSLVILSDCLGYMYPKNQGLAGRLCYTTVPDFCAAAQLGEALCIDVGRYQLQGMFGKFQVVNRRLTQMWPSVQQTSTDYDAYRELSTILEKWPLQGSGTHFRHTYVAWALQTSLRCWVHMHDSLITMAISGELDHLRNSQDPVKMERFLKMKQYSRTTRLHLRFNAKLLVDGSLERNGLGQYLLCGLKAGDDQDILSWATEYLSVNIATYHAPSPLRENGRRRWRCRMSSWGETDGSLPTIQYHFICQEIAKAGAVNPLYQPCATRSEMVTSREAVSHRIHMDALPFGGILEVDHYRNFPTLDDHEFHQLALLNVALAGDPTTCEALYPWALDLLRRYICSRSSKSSAELNHATMNDLRRVVMEVLSILASPEERARHEIQETASADLQPPAEFDIELFSPLAWNYGWLLERTWREHVVTAYSSSMDID